MRGMRVTGRTRTRFLPTDTDSIRVESSIAENNRTWTIATDPNRSQPILFLWTVTKDEKSVYSVGRIGLFVDAGNLIDSSIL